MATCLRFSDAAALALHTVDYLARNPGRLAQNQEIAGVLGVSANHLAKVHQRLAHAGLVEAVRGPNGGFRLARPAGEICLLAVVEAVDGAFSPNRCLLGREHCLRDSCLLGEMAGQVNTEVARYLTETTAADLAAAKPIRTARNTDERG